MSNNDAARFVTSILGKDFKFAIPDEINRLKELNVRVDNLSANERSEYVKLLQMRFDPDILRSTFLDREDSDEIRLVTPLRSKGKETD